MSKGSRRHRGDGRPARSVQGKPVPAPEARWTWSAWQTGAMAVAVIAVVGFGVVSWRGARPKDDKTPFEWTSASRATPAGRAKTAGDERGGTIIAQANQLLKEGKFSEAHALYREAAKLMPNDEDVHYNLGIALARLGETNEAIAEYEKALSIFPQYAEVHNNLGNLLLRAGKGDQAIEHFRAAIKSLPDYASAHNNLGNALRIAGQTDEAFTEFAKAAQLDTNYWEARLNLANAYWSQKQLEQAAAEYRQVLRLKPDFTPAQRALGVVEQQLAQPAPRPQ